jgi:N-acetylmuramoyl-L-alanine amidase
MTPKRITIHCSASKNGVRVPAAEIEKWHIARGFQKIGYHYVIQPDGEVEHGRPLNEQGAHVESANQDNVGICLVGLDHFTKSQFRALRCAIEGLRQGWDIPEWEVYCHNQWPSAQKQGKACPNMLINRVLCWLHLNDDKAIQPYILDGERTS